MMHVARHAMSREAGKYPYKKAAQEKTDRK